MYDNYTQNICLCKFYTLPLLRKNYINQFFKLQNITKSINKSNELMKD